MKKRKNTFGIQFHGAFGDEKAARKKKRRVHGFIKPRNIKGKRRFMVMSERKNPIRRKRKNALDSASKVFDTSTVKGLKAAERYKSRLENKYEKVTTVPIGLNKVRITGSNAANNPAELIVLGANPTPSSETFAAPQEFVLPPNSTITIRTNPTRVNAGQGYGYDFHGAFTENADAIEKEKSTPGAFIKGRITNRGFRWIVMTKRADEPRQNVEFGEFDHGIFHPWTRRPKTRRKPATRRLKTRGNPSAAALREEFTGAPAEFETVSTEPHMPAGDYAQLGELLALYVKPGRGQQVQQINFTNKPMLVSDESARQLYFVGGDQDISGSLAAFGAEDHGGGHFQLGEARRIDYKQRKEHVPHPSADEWRHEFGEESGVRPMLWFDANAKRLLLKGGEYEIRREGIVN